MYERRAGLARAQLLGVLVLLGCARTTIAPGPEAPGMHRETWYGWSFLLPDDCQERVEERFQGEPIGRVTWTCAHHLISLDATPFADPLHHTLRHYFPDGADTCRALQARDVAVNAGEHDFNAPEPPMSASGFRHGQRAPR
jgi:hypothetical protein